MLKSAIITVLLLISPFMFVNVCLIYGGAAMLGAYVFTVAISSFWIDPLSLCIVLFLLQQSYFLI